MHYEDVIIEEEPDIKEALTRLPQEEMEQRHWRSKRGMNLSLQHKTLPLDQYTKPEEVHLPYQLQAHVLTHMHSQESTILRRLAAVVKKERLERARFDRGEF